MGWLTGWNWWRLGAVLFSLLCWFAILAFVAALCGKR